ncbi:hypothetical protein MWN33_05240 [Starkeya koreensis]|uniref:Uncharacterized protein n=1 Tax=Ancylobacter koreensis TaxID=266121 RepID=A0ABT0DJI0_9HYPH|nr:hypothetical protein [Ancylobacter koreensis]MCK0207436.1 hypothetical protein [Ancylobacter koreensis]
MKDAIFLSAGVPDPRRGPEYAATADTVAITAAVSALIHVVLGRRPLVWGGQPAITPMILVFAEDIGVDYGRWVRLYQSRFFEDEFPKDNERFANVTFTEATPNDRQASLRHMRERMFSEVQFSSAVFIGGMDGVLEEYELFSRQQPKAKIVPISLTGGAALKIVEALGGASTDLAGDRDFVALFHRQLGISVRERRFERPDLQPAEVTERYWRPGDRS